MVWTNGETYVAVCDAATCGAIGPSPTLVIFLPIATTNPTGLSSLGMTFNPARTAFSGFDYGLGGIMRASNNEGDCTDSTCRVLYFRYGAEQTVVPAGLRCACS